MEIILRYNNFLETYKTRGYRLKNLEKFRYLFPIKTDAKIAGIIADIIGDGHLQGDPKWRIDYTSKQISELKRFENEIFSLYGIKGRIRNCTTNKRGKTFNIAINCAPIARIFFLLGTPAGQKVLTPFHLPQWIKNDKECFSRFAQRLFTCEGSVAHEKNRKTPQIRMSMWKEERLVDQGEQFFFEIEEALKNYFQINCSIRKTSLKNIRKDGIITHEIRMYILGDSVKKFSKVVGFEGEKQNL